MAYEQCYSENKLDGCMSIVAPWIVFGGFLLGVYGFYKLCTDEEFNQKNKKEPKIEQVSQKQITPKNVIEYKNIKII